MGSEHIRTCDDSGGVEQENKDTNAANLKRKFSFFSTDDAAEVQLGGYDPQVSCPAQAWSPTS